MDTLLDSAAPAPDPVQPTLAANEPIRLDGRNFRFVSQSLTAAQDDYIIGHLRRCGAIEALANESVPAERRAEDLLTRVMLAGETSAVLAGVLVQEGKHWTREAAERNAQRFASITDEGEKIAMRDMLIGFVIGFFDFARRSAATSRKSSSRPAEAPSTKSADPATSATSDLLSDASPAPTRTASSGC